MKWIPGLRRYTPTWYLEKMMHYKRSIIDVLKDVLPDLNMDEGRRLTLVEECHDRWVENARSREAGERRKDHETGLADNHSAACTPA